MIKNILGILFTLLLPISAFAENLKANIGINSSYFQINNPDYEYVDKFEEIDNPGLTAGLSYSFDNKLVLSATTNRIYNPEHKRAVINKSGIEFDNKSRITVDALAIGYAIKRFVPAVFIANVRDEESLYYHGREVGRTDKTAIVYGANFTYFLTRNLAGSGFIVAPNQELNLDFGVGLGVNYYFEVF